MAASMLALAAAAAILAIHGVAAQGPAAGPAAAGAGAGQDCFTALLGMADCLSYVTKGSNATKPDKPCCPELAGLVKNSPKCLCQLLSDPNKAGFDIDADRAMDLPSVCHVSTPPTSLCSLFGYPVGPAPAPTPGVQPPESGGSGMSGNPRSSGNRVSSIDRLHLAFPVGLALAFLPTLL